LAKDLAEAQLERNADKRAKMDQGKTASRARVRQLEIGGQCRRDCSKSRGEA